MDAQELNAKRPGGTLPRLPGQTVWLDMLMPTTDEISAVEALLDIELPSREEMAEIELSSRLYVDGPALVMTMPVLNNSAADEPESAPITFILVRHQLLTIRYTDPLSFKIFTRRINREHALIATGEQALLGLLEQVTDRLADILETSIADLEGLSKEIFRATGKSGAGCDFTDILRRIGRTGDLGSKIKDSLLGLNRLVLFLSSQPAMKGEDRDRTKTLLRDVASITEHATFVSSKIQFLLDATLGLINIEQNSIIKIFSVAAVAFLPPTLIASIYGMNYDNMPELHWEYGYYGALALMLVSAILPFSYFRYKKWL
ncbi:magnesium transporter CorA family protein [Phaeovibrio sulfidiphilus]|uniref:Magnesium transport protein CorA n=2 Tax=Phaeovibrio sulfidiphilus TaxID=1220600 RepID=A0A8J7CRW7_9PROT|nr:magnesium transporter CorA family protein [Phaeovibrio sulfidiphilus]